MAVALTKLDLQFLQKNVNRRFRILLVAHGAVSEQNSIKVGKCVAKSKIASVLLNRGQVSRVGQNLCAPRRDRSACKSPRR
jgi:hypothetical protein